MQQKINSPTSYLRPQKFPMFTTEGATWRLSSSTSAAVYVYSPPVSHSLCVHALHRSWICPRVMPPCGHQQPWAQPLLRNGRRGDSKSSMTQGVPKGIDKGWLGDCIIIARQIGQHSGRQLFRL